MVNQNNSITLEEAKKSLYQMSLIDDFLLNSTLSDEEYGREAARIILTTLLRQKIDVVDITPQKIYNGLNKSKHGIRLDAYITASSEDTTRADLYDLEAETRIEDRKTLPQRGRYYSAIIDAHHLNAGFDYDHVPTLVIIMILSYDPFTAGDMYYEASTQLITHPDIIYDDGIRRLYFYTGGNCNIPPEEGGERILDMLRYIQDSNDNNVMNSDIQELDSIVSKVRKSEEVSIKYMKSWEKEAILIRETTEKVTEIVTAEVTDRDARIYIEDLRDAGVSDDEIRQKLITRFGLGPEKADQMIRSTHSIITR